MNQEITRLAEAVERNNELLANVLRQSVDQQNLASIVAGHQKTMYGEDGRNGLVGDVATVKNTQENCPARLATQIPNRQGRLANWLSLAAFVLATLAFVAQLLVNQGTTP
jgi:hypothetical protein